jgi:hypothetical protein
MVHDILWLFKTKVFLNNSDFYLLVFSYT